jgi:hypothetical protein
MKGGGDAVSAARAVLQTGEYDYAWNLQVEDELLLRLEQGGKGRTSITPGGNIEFIQLNMADPWTEIEGERAHSSSKHPYLVRQGCARSHQLGGRSGRCSKVHLWSHWYCHVQLPEQPQTLCITQHKI